MRRPVLEGALCLLLAACSGAKTGDAPGAGGKGGGGPSGAAGATGGAAGATGGSAGLTGSAGDGSGGASGGPGGSGGGAGAAAGAAGATDAVVAAGSGGAGAGGTGGASGAGAGGIGGFGYSGGSRCAASGAQLCESFENGLDATLWMPLIAGDGTVTIDDTRAFRGAKSLHVKVVTGHKAAISESKTFPLPNNVLFARMFVWFDAFATQAHFTMMEAPQTAAGAWIRFGGQSGSYGVGTDHGASGDWLEHDTIPVPTKQWTCLEVEFKGDTNEFHVWQDEVERTALNVGAGKHNGFVMPAFTSLWFGWQTYSNQAPGEFWIDEIAVDGKRIGCAN